MMLRKCFYNNPVKTGSLSKLDNWSTIRQAICIFARDVVGSLFKPRYFSDNYIFLLVYHKIGVDITNFKLPPFTPFSNGGAQLASSIKFLSIF